MNMKDRLTYQYDASVKKVLANKKILAWILKECVSEFRDIPLDYIAKKCIGKTEIAVTAVNQDEPNRKADNSENIVGLNTEEISETEGTIYYDIRFNATVPGGNTVIHLIINIEAQKDDNPGYPILKRAVYYVSRLISAQKQTVFKHSDYGKINKVYSIWIVMNTSDEKKNTINEYSICEKMIAGNIKETRENYDLIDIIIVRLGDEDSIEEKSLLRMLNILLSKKSGKQRVNKMLKDEFGISPRGSLEKEINTMCNLGEGLYESAYQTAYQTASEEMRTKTWAEDAIKFMKKTNITAKEAVEILEIPEEKQKAVFALIEESLVPA